MADGASIGEVHVDVRPDASRFWAEFVAATKSGPPGGDIKVKVDADTRSALVKLGAVENRLKGIEGRNPDIKVRADTDVALAKLKAVSDAATALGRQRPDVKVTGSGLSQVATGASNAQQKVHLLASAGLALGPAIIPTAIAAAGAVGAIGVAGAAAVAGLGATALALVGPIKAVQAMAKAEEGAADAARTSSTRLRGVAGSTDQVRTAVAALANTRANADAAALRSAAQVEDAQRDVARAEADARRVRLSLTEAQREAKQEQEDLALSVRGTALAQERATAELAEARAAFDRTQGNPLAFTQEQKDEARRDFAEAQLRLDELAVRGRRLADEQATSILTGIDGSRQVVAARADIAAADERVAEANRRLTDAQRDQAEQVRQNQFAVQQAQQAIVSAQRSAAGAVETAGVAATAALGDMEAQLAKLSPEGREFSAFIFDLRGNVTSLQRIAEAGLLPGAQAGIESLLPYQPKLESFLGRVSGELGDITQGTLESFGSPVWRQFFGYIDSTAVPALRGMAQGTRNVAEGAAAIIVAFDPLNRQVGGGLIDVTEKFRRFATTLDRNPQFQEFVAYALARGPEVIDTLGEIAGAGVSLAQAYAPVGTVVLAVIRGIASGIDAIPVPVLTALVTALTAYKVVATGTELTQRALNSSLVAGAINMAGFGTQAQAAGLKTTAAKGNLSNLSGFLAGPWGIALTGATLALGALIGKQTEARAEAASLQEAAQQYGSILREGVTPATIASTQSLLRQNEGLRGLVESTRAAGVSTETLVAGLNGDTSARGAVIDALNRQIAAERLAASQARGASDSDNVASKAHRSRAEDLERMRIAFAKTNTAQGEAIALTTNLTQETRKASVQMLDYDAKIAAVTRLYEGLSQNAVTAADKARLFKDAIDAFTKTEINSIEAHERQVATLSALEKQFADNGAGLDLNKAKTDEQRRAVLANRDALEAALQASREKTLADIEAKVPVEEAIDANKRRIQEILKEIPANQRNTDEVKKLVSAYGDIPTEVVTSITAPNAEKVLAQLKDLKVAQYALDNNLTIPASRAALAGGLNTFESQVPSAARRATGGAVFGAGTETSDSIPALLSNNEHVWTAREVKGAGGHDQVAALRKLAASGRLPGFRAGGQVEWPFNVSTEDTYIPKITAGGAGARGYKWQIAVLREAFPALRVLSDFRPGSKTLSGATSYHALGRAVDLPPDFVVAAHIRAKYGALTKELITPFQSLNLLNGKPHTYTGAVWRQHNFEGGNAHIHWAYKDGGPVQARKFDTGGILPPGLTLAYNGTGRDEVVRTAGQEQALAGGGFHGTVQVFLGTREITDIVDVRVDHGLNRVARSIASGVRA